MIRYSIPAMLAFALLLSACNSAKKELGLERQSPDEFSVVQRAPLSLPPDYTLRPPRAGGPAAIGSESAQNQARRVILGTAQTDSSTAGSSSATDLLLQQAGAQTSQPNIRNVLDKETSVISTQNRTVAEKLLFWDKDKGPAVTPAEKLDPKTEAGRLNQQGITAPTPGEYRPSAAQPQ